MTEHAPTGALARAFAFPHLIHNWYQEQTFWLYYYGLSYDPKEALQALPLSPAFADKIAGGLTGARHNFIDNLATRVAAGDEGKPTFSDAFKGFLAFSQTNLRPVIDIAMRTGLGSPLRMAAIGMAILLVGDAFTGGHIRDGIVQTIASFNTGSGRTAHAVTDKDTIVAKADYRPEVFRLYAKPSFS